MGSWAQAENCQGVLGNRGKMQLGNHLLVLRNIGLVKLSCCKNVLHKVESKITSSAQILHQVE